MNIANHFTTKPAVKRLSYCSIGVPAVILSLTTARRLFCDASCEAYRPQGAVDTFYHWLSLHGPLPPPYIYPSGSGFALYLLALHAVPRAILSGVVARCLHNMFQAGPMWRCLYLILVFGSLVIDTQVTVNLSGITQLLNPEVPYYLSYIEFVGYSLLSMVVTCALLKMSGQGHESFYTRLGLLLVALMVAAGIHLSHAVHAAHCQQEAHVLCLLCQYGFLLCKLRFDLAFFRVIMDFLE